MRPNPKFPADLATLTEVILNEKHYFCSAVRYWDPLFLVCYLELLVCYLEQQLKIKGPASRRFPLYQLYEHFPNNFKKNNLAGPYKNKLPSLLKIVTLSFCLEIPNLLIM